VKDLNKKPLVVDIDQSLLRTDMLLESFWIAMGKDVVGAVRSAWQHLGDRALLKHEMARLSDLDVAHLPVNEEVLQLARDAQEEGREVILASGSAQVLVDRLGERLDIDGNHLGSDAEINLTGSNKRQALVRRYGEGGYEYIGDAVVDLSVWRSSAKAYVVGASTTMRRALSSMDIPTVEIAGGWRWRDLLRALRPHQWVKNILLLLPLIAAHDSDPGAIGVVLAAIVAFSFAASSIYIVNDLLDLEADRQHAKKKSRPFAAGTVPITVGMATSIGMGLSAVAIALAVDWTVMALVIVYMALSLSYSVYLKRWRWIVFMALGCVKRLTELSRAKNSARLPGRAYARRDRPDLLNVSILSAANAGIIFIAYTYSATAGELYAGLWELRWCLIPMTAWMVRMISTGWKGTQDFDPIVFAFRDKWSLTFATITVLGLFNAASWL